MNMLHFKETQLLIKKQKIELYEWLALPLVTLYT